VKHRVLPIRLEPDVAHAIDAFRRRERLHRASVDRHSKEHGLTGLLGRSEEVIIALTQVRGLKLIVCSSL